MSRVFIVWEVFGSVAGNSRLLSRFPYRMAADAERLASLVCDGYVLRVKFESEREPQSETLATPDASREPQPVPVVVPVLSLPVLETVVIAPRRFRTFATG